MTMNLKEGSRCVVNRNEDLATIDLDGDVSLAEKEVVVLSTTVMILTVVDFDGNGSLAEKEQTILLEQKRWSISCHWIVKERLVEIAAAAGFAADERAVECCRREGVVGRRVDLAIVSIGCFVFDRSVRPSLMQSGNLSVDAEEATVGRGCWRRDRGRRRNNRGAAVSATTTRAAARALSRGAAGEEGELSAEKVATMAGAGEEEIVVATARQRRSKDRAVGAAPFSCKKKIMVRAGAVNSDAKWRRLWWQRRTQGRKRPLRLGLSAVVVAAEARLRQKDEDEGSGYHNG
ncbi:hypothetical protein GW17_00052025 [Ensete ventricosum]|nr:hypothetical protein GW17_00052025 [Ensete ventricosum]